MPVAGSAVFVPAGETVTGVAGTVCSVTVNPGSGNTATLVGSLALNGPGISVPSATTLSLQGGTFTWPDGMPVLGSGSTGNGTVSIGSGATVVVQGLSTVGNINLQLAGGEIRGDATTAKPTLKQQGAGELDWSAGTISGTVLLDLLTNVDCTGCAVAAQAVVSTTSRTAFEFRTGTIDDEGTFVNGGIMRFRPGTSLTGTGTGVLKNTVVDQAGLVPPTIEFGPEPQQQSGPLTGPVTIDKVNVDNAQILDISSGTHVSLTGATSTFENGSTLDTPGGDQTPASMTIGAGATVNVVGSTGMKDGFILAIDDGSDGTHATLNGATSDATLTATVTSNQPVPGLLKWTSGAITGNVTVSGATTSVPSGSAARRLGGVLKLAGATTVGAATVTMGQSAAIHVTGQTTLAAPGARFDPVSGTSGQSITVESGGTVRRIPQDNTASTAPSEYATVNVPLKNLGRLELDASLDVPGGYSQDAVAQPATGASPPVTALLGGSTLKSAKNISISGGGIGGKGYVATPTLTISGAWIAPGYRANCAEVDATFSETCVGTLTVQGALHLTSTSDVQIVVRSDTTHDTLTTTGAATLAGKLTTATGANYKPKAGVAATKILRFPSRTGTFTTTASPSAPVGFGWRVSYDDIADSNGRGVDAKLVDNEAPVMGFAGIPAFTQQNFVEVIYAGVDNSSGVASYDVRWRRVGLTGAFSKWVYPKMWQHTKKKSQLITGAAEGYTYCASVRARDNAGNVSKWTPAPCSSVQLDDRFLRATGTWTRVTNRAKWYDKTFSRTTAHGAVLSKYATFTRIALSALHCPTCGAVSIYAGKTLIKTLDLKAPKFGRTNFVSDAVKLRTARVYVKVTSRHRLVQIDALGLLH